MGIFQKLNDEGITVVMVTHELDIAQFAKSNILFKDGKIIANNLVIDRKIAIEELKKIATLTDENSTTLNFSTYSKLPIVRSTETNQGVFLLCWALSLTK